jgi:hypothetical protein
MENQLLKTYFQHDFTQPGSIADVQVAHQRKIMPPTGLDKNHLSVYAIQYRSPILQRNPNAYNVSKACRLILLEEKLRVVYSEARLYKPIFEW